jgi:hypothetical protein
MVLVCVSEGGKYKRAFKETTCLPQDTRQHNVLLTLGTLYITLDRYGYYDACKNKNEIL